MRFDFTWNALESGLQAVAEGRGRPSDLAVSDALLDLGLVRAVGDDVHLTPVGERYHLAHFVRKDKAEIKDVLGDLLQELPVSTAFCSALWGSGDVSVDGALALLRRLRVGDDAAGRRWLGLMNRAGWIVYNPKHPKMRVLHNPQELVPPDAEADRERHSGHLISPDTRYGNLLALREMVRAGRTWIWWYEQHMPAKVLEVLYREVDGANVDEIRLLSGPANIDASAEDDFKRFSEEMKAKRGVVTEWRVLSKKESFKHHDRFFLTNGMVKNLPPLNTVLAGSTGEILPSDLSREEFLTWWDEGEPIASFQPPPSEAG